MKIANLDLYSFEILKKKLLKKFGKNIVKEID